MILHDDAARFDALYRMAHRLHADRRAWCDPLEPLRIALVRRAQAVDHEAHRMKAFVRFRPVADGDLDGGMRWVAWFEPVHHVVADVAPFFRDRFTSMHWALLTPRGSVSWGGQALAVGPAATAAQAPGADDGEALWLAYCRSIFNPARVNLAALKAEMPVRFWRNLPEATQIAPLVADAAARTGTMIDAPATIPRRPWRVVAAPDRRPGRDADAPAGRGGADAGGRAAR